MSVSGIVAGQITPATETPAIPSQRAEAAHLVVIRGPEAGTRLPLEAALIAIGRHRDNDIALGDTTVSERHAEIRVDGAHHVIADAGSFTGTYVNREPIDQIELHDGDEIWIGRHRLRFHSG
jgi:pSer/pThr/pTyr-binding forkhead associated (FHA) protein